MSNNQNLALQALSQDLYRVAIGRHRGQVKMAARFTVEALKRLEEINDLKFKEKITASLHSKDERSAEDLLMYSTLVRNRAE